MEFLKTIFSVGTSAVGSFLSPFKEIIIAIIITAVLTIGGTIYYKYNELQKSLKQSQADYINEKVSYQQASDKIDDLKLINDKESKKIDSLTQDYNDTIILLQEKIDKLIEEQEDELNKKIALQEKIKELILESKIASKQAVDKATKEANDIDSLASQITGNGEQS